jgi:hypothetical protein
VAEGDGCRVAYVVLLVCASAIVSPAQTFATRLNFNGSNGASPNNIVQASDGNLWGTTYGSGDTSCGTVFKILQRIRPLKTLGPAMFLSYPSFAREPTVNTRQ